VEADPPRVDRGGVRTAMELVGRPSAEVKGDINVEQFIGSKLDR
jgi:hypothetical protein